MGPASFTALELALLAEFTSLHAVKGFPAPHSLSVAARENTGAGRYVILRCEMPCSMEDGYLDLGGKYIEIPGVPRGLMAVVRVVDGCPKEMEIAVYGDDSWDGKENQWSIK